MKENEAKYNEGKNLLDEAINIGNKLRSLKNNPNKVKEDEKVFNLIVNTQYETRNLFVSNLSVRKTNEVKKYFSEEVDLCNKKAAKVLKFNKNQITRLKLQIEQLNKSNRELEDSLSKINNNCKDLDDELNKNNEQIAELQNKFELFEKVKPLLEHLTNEFPDESPIKIITEIKESKLKNFNKLKELNSLQNKFKELEKEKNDMISMKIKEENDLKNKISEVNFDTNYKVKDYRKTIAELKVKIQDLKKYQKNNIKMHSLLYQLYNYIIDYLKKNREYFFEEKAEKAKFNFNIKKKDFNPKIYVNEDEKLIGLLKNTILTKNANYRTAELLRQTVTLTNYMIRNFLKGKEYLRFDVIEALKELKNYGIGQQFENYKLECKIKNLKEMEKNGKNKINQLTKELKNLHRAYSREQPESKEKKPRPKTVITKRIKEKTFITTHKYHEINKSSDSISKSSKKSNKLRLGKNNRVKSLNRSISKISESESSELSQTSNDKENEPNKNIPDVEFKKFKNLEISKNQDKIIKKNGNSGVDSFLSGIKKIVENTNRVYYYQTRATRTLPKNLKMDNIVTENNMTTNSTYKSKGKNVKTETNKSYSKGNGGYLNTELIDRDQAVYDNLSTKIFCKLNNMIYDAQDTDKRVPISNLHHGKSKKLTIDANKNENTIENKSNANHLGDIN